MCVAAASRAVLVNKAVLCLLLPVWHATSLKSYTEEEKKKKEKRRGGLWVCACTYTFCMLLWNRVFARVWGVGWTVEGRWFGHRPDWLPGSPGRTANPRFPLRLTPTGAGARFNTASTKQTQTPTVPLYVACRGCARRLVENPCLYRSHNMVDLQRETPAHARTTQNITDHLLNTEIQPHCNVKVWGYRGL